MGNCVPPTIKSASVDAIKRYMNTDCVVSFFLPLCYADQKCLLAEAPNSKESLIWALIRNLGFGSINLPAHWRR